MQNGVRKINESLRKKKAAAGRAGGLSTVAKYGPDYMKEIGRRGAKVFHARYRLTPAGVNDFAIVNRETGEVKAFLNGLPF